MQILSGVFDWIGGHAAATGGLIAASIVVLVGSLWAGHRFLTSVPPDYFVRRHRPLEAWKQSHPARRWAVLIIKNVAGAVLTIAGIVMIFTPGQGILALLLGLSLLDIPGKQAIERRILKQKNVLRLVNRLRARAGQPPLVLDEHSDDAPSIVDD